MSLERGRALMHGIMILAFTAIALWVSTPVGLVVLAVLGLMRLQEVVTDWCPSDLFLKPMGLKKRSQARG